MTVQITPAPVRREVLVKASPEHAFKVFTDGFDRWWPRSHSIGESPLKEARLEPGVGGDPDFLTEVEVRFTPEAAGVRVALEHRNLERYGEHAQRVADSVGAEGGWGGLLQLFAAEAEH